MFLLLFVITLTLSSKSFIAVRTIFLNMRLNLLSILKGIIPSFQILELEETAFLKEEGNKNNN